RRPRRGPQPGRRPPLPAPRDGSRRLLRLPAARAPGVAGAVRPLRQGLRGGVHPRAVQPPVRPPPAGVVRPEAPRGGLGRDLGRPEDNSVGARRLAYDLIRRLEQDLVADVYRWTGHFPERTRPLLRHLARRAEELKQVYPEERELQAAVALTTLVTALAMNH